MALLPILTAPDKRLKRPALPVKQVNDAIRRLMEDMAETMYHAQGIGLAAPQVDVPQRVIVVDVEYGKENGGSHPIFLANPEIVSREGEVVWNEGCLSVPEHTSDVTRIARIVVRGWNQHGQEVIIEAEGLLAVCFQHEIDHLDGILFIDRLSSLKRSIILRKLKKHKSDTKQK
ncbi:MAG: peptide deformylase [Magnetococcales bacterium]|nr:peptide deformylase [Magnetococcales bacterium]